MKTRKEIKKAAKMNLKNRYWACVGVAFLLPLLVGLGQRISEVGSELSGTGATLLLIIGYAATFFLCTLDVGMKHFFTRLAKDDQSDVEFGDAFSSSFSNYGRKLGGLLWESFWLIIWSLPAFVFIRLGALSQSSLLMILAHILLIPAGIIIAIKYFSYGMTAYILADCPEVKAVDALSLSKRIMAGNKWSLCVMYLSFIGWYLLSVFTIGLLAIFYVEPYRQNALAGFYLELKDKAIREGIISESEFGTETMDLIEEAAESIPAGTDSDPAESEPVVAFVGETSAAEEISQKNE